MISHYETKHADMLRFFVVAGEKQGLPKLIVREGARQKNLEPFSRLLIILLPGKRVKEIPYTVRMAVLRKNVVHLVAPRVWLFLKE